MTEVNLPHFTMRTTPPKADEDWFRIVKGKKGEATKVYIYDEIGFWGTTAKDFAALLDEIDTDEIHLHVNSPGGSVFDGIAIHSSLDQHPAKVTAFVDGLAASAASFIVQAADERVMARNAQMMIHDAKAYAGGNAAQMRKAAELLDNVSDNIADIYAQRGAFDASEFRDLMKAETWYTGNEAKDAGLVDTVTNAAEEETEDPADKWDLKAVFNFPGREVAPAPAALLNKLAINNRVEEAHAVSKPEENPTTTPPTVQQPPAPQTAPPVAEAHKFIVNGVEVTDFSAVQAHIETLETFKKETVEGARKSFVASLAQGPNPRIAATQITDMEEFALSLSNEQFDKWKASMEAAPSHPLLGGKYGTQSGDEGRPANGDAGSADLKAKQDRVKVLTEIIESHRATNMTEEQIKEKASYKELQNLLAELNQ